MSLKRLDKLRIIRGDDMFPSIYPGENLLLDRNSEPKIGDVVLFENRFGLRIAHRLVCKIGKYYFTRGDNCNILNFPCTRKDILGIVVSKRQHPSLKYPKLLLSAFILYYSLYSSLFDIRKKNNFFMLTAISRFFAPLEGIIYKSRYPNKYLNRIIYMSRHSSYGQKILPRENRGYHIRKIKDNNIWQESSSLSGKDSRIFDAESSALEMVRQECKRIRQEFSRRKMSCIFLNESDSYFRTSNIDILTEDKDPAKIMESLGWKLVNNGAFKYSFSKQCRQKSLVATIYKRLGGLYKYVGQAVSADQAGSPAQHSALAARCIKIFEESEMTLHDVKIINLLWLGGGCEKCLDGIDLGRPAMRDMIGLPLIIAHLFNARYAAASNGVRASNPDASLKKLSDFVRMNFGKELAIVEKYMKDMDYEMPLKLYYFHNQTKTFKIYSFLHPPTGYDLNMNGYGLLRPIVWLSFYLKQVRLRVYMNKHAKGA